MNQKAPSGARTLRSLLDQGELVVAPGCGDALTARLIEASGFKATCMSGAWTAGTRGLLDNGCLTMNEMVENAKCIAQSVSIPVISDADTGFGDYANVRRCVQEFEIAGLAGIHIEDQDMPKKCGLMAGKKIIPVHDMVRKLHAAVDARSNPDFVLIARTDALEPEGLEGAIARGCAYFDAGADMLMVEGFRAEEEIWAVAEAFSGRHLFFNRTPRGHTPLVPLETLGASGFNFIVFPMHLVLASLSVQKQLLDEIRETGACASFEESILSFDEYFALLGAEEMIRLDQRYAGPALSA